MDVMSAWLPYVAIGVAKRIGCGTRVIPVPVTRPTTRSPSGSRQ